MVVTERNLQIGYLVTAYHEQSQLQRLLRALLRWDPAGEIALHFDRSKADLDLSGLEDGRLHVLTEWSPVTWGDSSYLRVLIRGLQWWSHRDVDWVIVLSGQDYPVRPVSELREFLANSGRNSFIRGGKLRVPPPRYRVVDLDGFRQRYFVRWGKVPRILWSPPARPVMQQGLRLVRRLLPGGLLVQDLPHNDRPWVGWRPLRGHPFTEDWPCCVGSDYFAADQHAISILTSNEERITALYRWYERSIIPTESFFITVLRGHPSVRSEAEPMHFVRWDDTRDPHPVVLDEHSFDAIRESGCFFARKFDSESTSVLDRIDLELLGLELESRASGQTEHSAPDHA